MFEVLCKEKKEVIWRQVSIMPRTISRIMEVVDLMRQVSNFLPGDNPYSVFTDENSTFFQVDNVGLIAVIPIEDMLHCHITFWDRRLRGRERLCRSLAEFVVGTTKKLLYTAIPEGNRVVLEFARRVGFKEGYRSNGVVFLVFTNYTE